jgi:hypothetical protein
MIGTPPYPRPTPCRRDAAHQRHLATRINYAALADQPAEDATPTDTP